MMITQVKFSVRAVTPDDRQKLANLIHFEVYVHRHLDWRSPLDWVGQHPYLMAEQDGRVLAALACPPDPKQVAWIRLFAVSTQISIESAWEMLWPEAREQCLGYENPRWIAAIPLQRWFQSLLEDSGFEQTHRVVMLSWERGKLPPDKPLRSFIIRPMTLDDMDAIHEIDASSFVPVWQNSKQCLEVAFRQAAVATVVEDQGRLIGYQISTATPMGGHLARLAVLPQYQGRGIGYALVRDVLSQFLRRGGQSVSVNTQQDNEASLTLYRKAGFHLTGEEYPIYQYDLKRH